MSDISDFVTNTDRPVFGLRNLPEVVKGALFSRYSRSEKSLRDVLADEFMDAAAASTESAEAFYDRVLVGYGDDSVAELGNADLSIEQVSNLAAEQLVDSRLGLSFLIKSSRYVHYGRKNAQGQYGYYRDLQIMASPHAEQYIAAMDGLFDTYNALIEPVSTYLKHVNPRTDDVTPGAYNRSIRAQAFDLLRGLLPLATLTNVGMKGNGRAFEYSLIKLRSHPIVEYRLLADAMQQELDTLIPSFVKRAKSDKGALYSQYLREMRECTWGMGYAPVSETITHIPPVALEQYDTDAVQRVVAGILYEQDDMAYRDVRWYVDHGLSLEDYKRIIDMYVGMRNSRHQHVGRALEATSYTFDIVADIGAYRDLHRHRICSQTRQQFTCDLGFYEPAELAAAGVAEQYRTALACAQVAYNAICRDLPAQAQYCVPFAFNVRWSMQFNLREAYHLIELRTQRQGHPGYRKIAQEMYRSIQRVHPLLASGMMFADMQDYGLARLAAEQKHEPS